MKKTNGYTLIELLVASAIIMVITGFGLAGWTRFREKALVTAAADKLKTELRLVRSWAINGQKPSSGCGILDGYRVEGSNSNLNIFACCDGDGDCDLVKTTSFGEGLDEINPSSFQITFLSLTGTTDLADDSLTIALRYHDQEQTVTISQSGEIE